jgi:hypothetical protein
MIINRKTVKLEDGSYESTWSLTEDQVNYFLTFAINVLVAKGAVEIADVPPEDVLDSYDVKNSLRN